MSEVSLFKMRYKTYPAGQVISAFSKVREAFAAEKTVLEQSRQSYQVDYDAWPHRDAKGRPVEAPTLTDDDAIRSRVFFTIGPIRSFLLGLGFRETRISWQEIEQILRPKDSREFIGNYGPFKAYRYRIKKAPTIMGRLAQHVRLNVADSIERTKLNADYSQSRATAATLTARYNKAVYASSALENPPERLKQLNEAIAICDDCVQNVADLAQAGITILWMAKNYSCSRLVDRIEAGDFSTFHAFDSRDRKLLEQDLSPGIQMARHQELHEEEMRDQIAAIQGTAISAAKDIAGRGDSHLARKLAAAVEDPTNPADLMRAIKAAAPNLIN